MDYLQNHHQNHHQQQQQPRVRLLIYYDGPLLAEQLGNNGTHKEFVCNEIRDELHQCVPDFYNMPAPIVDVNPAARVIIATFCDPAHAAAAEQGLQRAISDDFQTYGGRGYLRSAHRVVRIPKERRRPTIGWVAARDTQHEYAQHEYAQHEYAQQQAGQHGEHAEQREQPYQQEYHQYDQPSRVGYAMAIAKVHNTLSPIVALMARENASIAHIFVTLNCYCNSLVEEHRAVLASQTGIGCFSSSQDRLQDQFQDQDQEADEEDVGP